MTIEDAIQVLHGMQADNLNIEDGYTKDRYDALEIAIKALEREPFMNKPCVAHEVCHEDKVKVLEKIKAEIEVLDIFYDNDYFSGNRDAMFKCNDVLQIIDKYRKEQKDADSH